jgi:hypothetical protein
MFSSIVVEVNLFIIAALSLVPALLVFLYFKGRNSYLKGKILDGEFEMVKSNAYQLELEQENTDLRKQLSNQPQAGVVSMKEKTSRTAAG